jgi:tRNA dimethylallyltransferase
MMLNEGLLAEAQALYPNKQLNALQTVGYRELFDYFDSNIKDSRLLENAIEQIKMNTRRFAKRQMTWFKRTENVSWFDFLVNKNEIIKTIELTLK